MALQPISEVRQRNHVSGNRTARQAIERASTFVLTIQDVPLNATADLGVGTVLYDCEFLGGYCIVSADEGTDIVGKIESWDDAAGTAQVALSAEFTFDAAAASNEAITAVADNLVSAGYIINLLISTAASNAVTGDVTLFFKTVDDLGEDG